MRMSWGGVSRPCRRSSAVEMGTQFFLELGDLKGLGKPEMSLSLPREKHCPEGSARGCPKETDPRL